MARCLALTLALVVWFSFSILAVSAEEDSLYGAWAATGPASNATPSYLGSTGLLITPTAMVTAPWKVSGYFHEINSDDLQTFYGLTVGLPAGLEVSGLWLQNLEPLPSDPDITRDETVLNAKWQLPLGPVLGNPLAPKVAVGAFDATDEVNRTYYVAVSRSFSLVQNNQAPLNVHVGWGNAKVSGTRLDGFFGGVDLSPFPHALVQVEYDAKDLNAGLRYYPVPYGSLDVGVVAGDFAWGATLRSDW